MRITETVEGVRLARNPYLDLGKSFDCGQAFRFESTADGYAGVVGDLVLRIREEPDSYLFSGLDKARFDRVVRPFLDLDRDYAAAERTFLSDPVLAQAAQYGRGIRILRQDPFEALITFIFSQNNNIPRIRGMVRRLCEGVGAPVRAGFRAKYAVDAARRVCDGSVPLGRLASLPYAQAQALLMTIRGVGVKVADCVLLFGAGRLEAFPVDVWMKRACARFYPGGQAPEFGPYAGLAQQYLFHYVRGLSA